ncbi:carbohydrate ABC transporter permease [Agromyces archimandritae]|uniref:Carbohydrate ABC transporter permease n=1 Tax=Agromyces archimandritae TaxID=2781962 RepID=A0A975IP30_9MICO|nr:carbohydrate ABC transporter permease [Agromyces archimandritae]QTX05180.1 carbohydrate ABC transporter permease [Agromyces archimandritae]
MRRSTKILIAVVVLLFCAVQLVPFYLALTTAFKEQTDLSSVWWFPFDAVTFDNFSSAVEDGGVLRAIGNSVIVTVVTTVLTCVLAALAAYPLARRRTRLNRSVEFLILAVMMVPPLSILVPLYSLLNQLGLLNTYAGLILPLTCLELPRAIFLYTQFLRAVPLSLEEAARVDGANRLQTLSRIVFPLLKPVTATVVILTSVYVWNEFALSSYILTGNEMRTLAPAIASFFGSQGSNVNAAVASALIGVVPMLVAYLFLQRYFMKGMLAGAEK